MEIRPDQLLRGHTRLDSRDLAEFHAHIATMEGAHDRHVPYSDGFHMILRQFSMDGLEVGVHYSSTPITVTTRRARSASYLVQFPLTGSIDVDIDGRAFTILPEDGLVISPAQKVHRTGRPGWFLVLEIDIALVRSRFSQTRQLPAKETLRFHPLISDGSRGLRHYGLLLVEAIDRGAISPDNQLANVLREGLVDLLLRTQPHNHRADGRETPGGETSDRLARLDRYIEQHYREPLNLEQLAVVAECSERALQRMFADYFCVSPIRYVERRRLAKARELLEAGGGRRTVAQIAEQCGFSHLSRFAHKYRERYGEPPSETLRRQRKKQRRDAGSRDPGHDPIIVNENSL